MGPKQEFLNDDRAIEGLPIRLVIALVVGVAALAIMTSMLGGINSNVGKTEVTVEYSGNAVIEEGSLPTDLSMTVKTENGEPVQGATVIIEPNTAELNGTFTARTNQNGVATVRITDDVQLRSDQSSGSLTVNIRPPSGDNLVDREKNSEIVIVKG